MKKVSESIYYIGVNDHEIDLFEGQYIVPLGMSYNSYLIMDEQVAVMDTVDAHFVDEWLANLSEALSGRTPDYLVVQHMEPDHSAGIGAFLRKYPLARVVATDKAFKMLSQFQREVVLTEDRRIIAGPMSRLELGAHTLTFVHAPMVHWPEVMMSYEEREGILFSADAFGKFGALDTVDPEGWACEARRYYFGIVGKYGAQVQALLKKAAGLDIRMICPLHGPVLDEDISYYIGIYDTWSSYKPEDRGVLVAYTSVYGHTREAAEYLALLLSEKGEEKVALADLARDDWAETVEDAFRFDRMVIATTTYNGDIFPAMRSFLEGLVERGYQSRAVAIIENGSWAPQAAKKIRALMDSLKNLSWLGTVSIMSSMSEANREEIAALADELLKSGAV